MSGESMLDFRPFRPICPGELIKEEVAARGWNSAVLGRRLRLDIETVEEIIGGGRRITASTALALSRALGTSCEYWLNLDSAYRADLDSGERKTEPQD